MRACDNLCPKTPSDLSNRGTCKAEDQYLFLRIVRRGRLNEMRDSFDQNVGLSGTGRGDDEDVSQRRRFDDRILFIDLQFLGTFRLSRGFRCIGPDRRSWSSGSSFRLNGTRRCFKRIVCLLTL